MNVYDIALKDDDVKMEGGDFATEESTLQHQRQIALNNSGDFKQTPLACVGAETYLNDENGIQELINALATAFSGDGMTVQNIGTNAAGELVSKAIYK